MKGEKMKLKKYLMIPLFSTLFLMSGVIAFADEETPTTPSITEETPVPVPEVPDTGGEQPIVPDNPGTSETEEPVPVTPENPDIPVNPPIEPIEGGETSGTTTPIDPGTTTEQPGTTEIPGSTTTDSSTTEQPTTPSTSEESGETPTEESMQPKGEKLEETSKEEKESKPVENKPASPVKEITVSVDSSGKITNGFSQGTSVPIVTSDVKEISHVPTLTTPLQVESGQTIVGVKDGVPLVQDEQGNLVEDQSIPVKKLPSGNIEVKTADGKTKVLPKTGEEVKAALSVLGTILTSVAGFFGYKRNKKIMNDLK